MFLIRPKPGPLLSDRFGAVIDGLAYFVTWYAKRNPATQPIHFVLWGRLLAIAARFTKLSARMAAGQLRPRNPDRVRPPAPDRPPESSSERPPGRVRKPAWSSGLPRGFGWLARAMPGSAVFGSQLNALLAEPEMQALLAATPQAAKLIYPLCRMLAVEPAPKPPRPRAPRKPRKSRSNPSKWTGPGPRPLPYGPTSVLLTDAQLLRALGLSRKYCRL